MSNSKPAYAKPVAGSNDLYFELFDHESRFVACCDYAYRVRHKIPTLDEYVRKIADDLGITQKIFRSEAEMEEMRVMKSDEFSEDQIIRQWKDPFEETIDNFFEKKKADRMQQAKPVFHSDKYVLPTDPTERKAIPLATGCVDYFPAALAEIAKISKKGNDQHNPGQPLHWARGKSMDHADTILRHFVERGSVDVDGTRHSAKMAWRALALLQEELEQAGAPMARGAK